MAVYIARAGDKMKIGWSGVPTMRIRELRTERKLPFELVRVVVPGDEELERRFHKHFALLSLGNEMFSWTAEVLTVSVDDLPASDWKMHFSNRSPRRCVEGARVQSESVGAKIGWRPVSLRIPETEHDVIKKAALARGMTITGWVRKYVVSMASGQLDTAAKRTLARSAARKGE